MSPRAQASRLLFVATSEGQGGIERHSVRLAQLLDARGASVTYACRPGAFVESLCARSSVTAFPLVVRNSGDLRAAGRLARLITRQQIDVVHVHSRRDFVVAVLAVAWARLRRPAGGPIPRLVLHAHLIKTFGVPAGLAGRFFGHGADAVVTVSEAARIFLLDHHRLPPSFVSVIPNGVDVNAYSLSASMSLERRAHLRRQWDIPAAAPVVGMVGRLNAKGQRALLRVAPALLVSFPDVYFVFIGPEGECGDRHALQLFAEGLGVVPRVVFAGPSEDVPGALAALDVLAHLPTEEAFGLALVEAMAAGVPVVAANVGGCAEIVTDGVTGALVHPKDEGGLIAALSTLLCRSGRPQRERMALAGRRHVQEKFALKQQAESLEALYHRLRNPLPGG